VLIGETLGALGASLYLREILGREDGAPPPVDLALERKTGDFLRGLIHSGQCKVVHDLSDGGLAIAAAEMALASGVGMTLDAGGEPQSPAALFGEDQARYLVAAARPEELLQAARATGIAARVVGKAGGEALVASGLFSIPLDRLQAAHEGWLPAFMGSTT
jgi:phosphoribosylformylglycinamidine synthase